MRGDLMLPEKLAFLDRFDNFYQAIVNSVKEDKYNEQEFYLIIIAKAKGMNRKRINKLNKLAV